VEIQDIPVCTPYICGGVFIVRILHTNT